MRQGSQRGTEATAGYSDGIQGKRTFKEEVRVEAKELLLDIAVRKTLTTMECLSTMQLWVWKEKCKERRMGGEEAG